MMDAQTGGRAEEGKRLTVSLRGAGQLRPSMSAWKPLVAVKQPCIEVIVAIISWHFLSVPLSVLSLCPQPQSGRRCTQLKTCNSLSGILCRERRGRSQWLGAGLGKVGLPLQHFILHPGFLLDPC